MYAAVSYNKLRHAFLAGQRWALRHPDEVYGTFQDLYARKVCERGEDWATLWMQGVVTTYFREPAGVVDL
jgi:hypothetical protein